MTVTDGDGYTVGVAASGSITIEDDDEAPATPDWTDYQTVVNYLVEVRDNPKNTAVKGNAAHIAKWNRVLEAVGHDTGTGLAPMAASGHPRERGPVAGQSVQGGLGVPEVAGAAAGAGGDGLGGHEPGDRGRQMRASP